MKSILTLGGILSAGLLLTVPLLLGQGYSPSEAPQRMSVADGLQVRLVAAEPMVRQPVAIEFDDRSRLWVIQYLQYPNPAGLTRVRVDRYSRTQYDRVPEPPPRGPQGADRITILADFDRDGRARQAKDFVSRLNLASGLAFGHGGVFVLQAPYLLFYPDRNGDDIPDGDPDVLLTGFGMEDAHSVANSLTWGPDGWLYGCQGSTVTARIRGVEFQQGVWRYHPITRRFELFCEGGGNSWGLDFDEHGELLYSTNHGGYVMLHGVQGGYYWKQFGKHGALHNPHTYGYLDHVPHRNFRGGHVSVGGIFYRGDSFPARYRGKYLAADLLGHAVYWHDLHPTGSTFRSSHGGELLLANDTWFAPSDVTLGPDGAVYVADWYDKRTAHPDPDADWDRSNGRIYKIEARGASQTPLPDPTGLPSDRLVALLSHPNHWYVRKARRILADRRDPEVIFPLRTLVLESKDDRLALEALWALYVSGGFDESFARSLLAHRNPHVRRWTVRLLGDENRITRPAARALIAMAATEPNVVVRSQLASTAKRLPAEDGLPIVHHLLRRDEDGRDAHVPLLLWWAVEHHAMSALDDVVARFTEPAAWKTPLIRDVILGRLMRRYAAAGTERSLQVCGRLLASAPQRRDRTMLVEALESGLRDRTNPSLPSTSGTLFTSHALVEPQPTASAGARARLPEDLQRQLIVLWNEDASDFVLLRILAWLGHAPAQAQARQWALDPHTQVAVRVRAIGLLGECGLAAAVPELLELVGRDPSEAVQLAALNALQHFDDPEIAPRLLRTHAGLTRRARSRLHEVLLSRKAWAHALLRAVDEGRHTAADVGLEELRLVSLHEDRGLDELVRKHWGSVARGTPEEKLAEMRRLSNDLRAAAGDPHAGRELFRKHCATCHRLHDEGNQVGPDLTHANRQDRDFLLASIVDPSAVIRKEFLSYIVQTRDGRLLTGLIVEQSAGTITVVDAKNERRVLARDQVESLRESPVSLMPENLLKDLKPDEVRDLFSYLQSDKPLVPRSHR
jgi:putative membrane-bound dehydrogenase-like protein